MFLVAERVAINSIDRMPPSDTLLASLIWGGVGSGFFVYGMKQRATVPSFGGIALLATTYFVESSLWMSILCIGLLAAMYFLRNSGD